MELKTFQDMGYGEHSEEITKTFEIFEFSTKQTFLAGSGLGLIDLWDRAKDFGSHKDYHYYYSSQTVSMRLTHFFIKAYPIWLAQEKRPDHVPHLNDFINLAIAYLEAGYESVLEVDASNHDFGLSLINESIYLTTLGLREWKQWMDQRH